MLVYRMLICSTLLSVFYFSACKSHTQNTPMQVSQNVNSWPEWAKNANIYEVNIRQYTPEGTFNAFSEHLPRLQEMGIDILWLMPVFPISTTKRKGSLGSYYAVSNFRSANPEFGTDADLKNLIDRAHQHGMKVILDWVPNHTGWDHKWISTNPDFYTKDASGNIVDPQNDDGTSMGWDDVADLNYSNQSMRQAMVDDMIFWIKEYQIDGFRQDMALLVPLDFWENTSKQLRAVKSDIFLLAESEVHDHLNNQYFNAMYSWSLHHILNDVAQGKKKAAAIADWYTNERPKVKHGCYMHFTSNHDENSWSGSEIERMGEAHQAFATLVTMLDGIPLIYTGQEEPMPQRLKFFEKDTVGFKDFAYADFYKKLFQIKHENPALWNADFGGPLVSVMPHEDIFAFERTKGDNHILVVINLSKQMQSIPAHRSIGGVELLSGKPINFNEGDAITLKPWESIVVK